jgi:hypothetical protein
MNKTRYFGIMVDPKRYRRGFGVRGWWINVLNRLRASIERYVAIQILIFESEHVGISREEIKELVIQAKEDPLFVPPFDQKSERKPRTLARDKIEALYESANEKAEGRYREGRKNTEPERPVSLEEGPIVTTLADYEKRANRSLRYYRGRGHSLIVDGDDIEEVK